MGDVARVADAAVEYLFPADQEGLERWVQAVLSHPCAMIDLMAR